MMIAILVIIVFAIYYFVKEKKVPDTGSKEAKTAEQILNERYVAGEVNEETFLRMKQIMKE